MAVTPAEPETRPRDKIARGTAAFRGAVLSICVGGFATFALLYCVQPLMPLFVREFRVSAATASLAISLTTGVLAPMLIVASSAAESWDRKRVMVGSLLAASALTIAAAAIPGFSGFLVTRALLGVALSGLPAISMAYLAEEIDPRALGSAVGILIAGNALGGLAGRSALALASDLTSWRLGLGGLGVLGLLSAWALWRYLQPSRHFQPRRLQIVSLVNSLVSHLRDPGLRWLFLLSFLLMGGFVTIYNYVAFLISVPPYALSQTWIGAIFVVYLLGMVASTIAGRLADRLGRGKVLPAMVAIMLTGVLLTALPGLTSIILGLATMTFGFFASHSVASSWVGRRAVAAKGQASSLYLFSYYAGSSLVGSFGGILLQEFGWYGVVSAVAGLVLIGLLISFRLARLTPIAAIP